MAQGGNPGGFRESVNASSPQIFVEKIKRPLPGELGGGLVVTGGCVVVEPVIGALVDIGGVGRVVGFQGFLIGGPSAGQARVQGRIVQQERGLDLGGIVGGGVRAVG